MSTLFKVKGHPILKTGLPEFITVACALTPAVVIFWQSSSRDAAIYFTFIKNFFTLPFSFQPQTVAFGATSPLYVIIHAPIHAFFAEQWWAISKVVNFTFLISGLVLLSRSIRADYKTLGLIVLLASLSPIAFITAAQGYETPLAFLTICGLYALLKKQRYYPAIILSGIMYLVRPEFLIIALVVHGFLIKKISRPPHLLLALLALLPLLSYHLYMGYHTGALIPTSIYVRATTPETWSTRLLMSGQSFTQTNSLIYLIGFVTIAMLAISQNLNRYRLELTLLMPLPILHLLFPPGEHTARYLLPLTPLVIIVIIQATREWLFLRLGVGFIWLALLGLYGYHWLVWSATPAHLKENMDTLLLKELAGQINHLAVPNDKILLEEIQAQYFLEVFAYSPNGVVGNQLFRVSTGEERLEDFIQTQQIRYIVTSDSLNEAEVLGSLLPTLSRQDRSTQVGDTVTINELTLQKRLANRSTNPAWNSLYQVLK